MTCCSLLSRLLSALFTCQIASLGRSNSVFLGLCRSCSCCCGRCRCRSSFGSSGGSRSVSYRSSSLTSRNFSVCLCHGATSRSRARSRGGRSCCCRSQRQRSRGKRWCARESNNLLIGAARESGERGVSNAREQRLHPGVLDGAELAHYVAAGRRDVLIHHPLRPRVGAGGEIKQRLRARPQQRPAAATAAGAGA